MTSFQVDKSLTTKLLNRVGQHVSLDLIFGVLRVLLLRKDLKRPPLIVPMKSLVSILLPGYIAYSRLLLKLEQFDGE